MAPSTLRIRLFGEVDLRRDGTPLPPLESARAESLLANLLLHREAPQPRHQLAFLLWPDSTESQARTNLRHVLHNLRRALPEPDRFLAVTPRTLRWRADAPFWLDVAAFDEAIARAGQESGDGLAALREAVALYAATSCRGATRSGSRVSARGSGSAIWRPSPGSPRCWKPAASTRRRSRTPRVVPLLFHWTGEELVLTSWPDDPKVAAPRDHPAVALTIDTDTPPFHVLSPRGMARVTIVDDVAAECLPIFTRYLGPEQGRAWTEMMSQMTDQMARIAIRPEWVGVLDFETRFPSGMARRRGAVSG